MHKKKEKCAFVIHPNEVNRASNEEEQNSNEKRR